MNILEKNLEIIKRLKESSPEFNNLQVSGNILIYNNQSFNLNEIDLETVLPNILPDVSASTLSDDTNKKDIEKQWEVIKKSDPNMKDITIFLNHRIDLNKDEEFINIRTSDGINHLFKNDKNLNIFEAYNEAKRIYGDNITQDTLAKYIEKFQLTELSVEPAENIIANPSINENIKNQLQEYIERYKGQNNIKITANVSEDIIYINDLANPDNNFIITFDKDINHNLEAIVHKTNVSSEETYASSGEEKKDNQVSNDISNSAATPYNTDYQNSETIISDEEFKYLISNRQINENNYQQIKAYLDNVKNMISNKDSNAEIKIKNIEESITNLILMDNLTEIEQSIINEANGIANTYNDGLSKGQVLTYRNAKIPPITEGTDNNTTGNNDSGYLNIVSIFVIISAILIGLSIFALYIINGK